jgi:hypothetical protein
MIPGKLARYVARIEALLGSIPQACGNPLCVWIFYGDASHGEIRLPVVQILQPLNFWIGVIPTLILAGWWWASSFIARSSWWERAIRRLAAKIGYLWSFVITSLVTGITAVFEARVLKPLLDQADRVIRMRERVMRRLGSRRYAKLFNEYCAIRNSFVHSAAS